MGVTVGEVARETRLRRMYYEYGGISEVHPAWSMGNQREPRVPDIMEFTFSDKYLNKPTLYPRQATALKVMALQPELFTDFDWHVLGEWTEGFKYPTGQTPNVETQTLRYEGEWGINPDIIERMMTLKEWGHRWFSVVCAVQGRRSGKGHLGAIMGAYVLWNYLCLNDPKGWYGVDPAKRLACQVFAGKKAQARDNQWRDIANAVLSAPCFDNFRSQSLVESMTILAPDDRRRAIELDDAGRESAMDIASFEIVPKEATTMAARGPASFMQYFDEMAHMVNTGVSRSADEVWNSANPALDQFKQDSFVYCGSSPWAMQGKFYELVQTSLEFDAQTHQAIDPTILTLQLASWDIYEDYQMTQSGEMEAAPRRRTKCRANPVTKDSGLKDAYGKPIMDSVHDDRGNMLYHWRIADPIYFTPLRSAIQEYDAKMQREERLNPDTFRVERRSKWATAQDAYFDPHHIARTFLDWNGLTMEQKDVGQPGIYDYIAHADPGKTGSNFGFAIAHVVPDPDGSDIPHVVFDRVHAWSPGDFPVYEEGDDVRYEMDYVAIEEDMRKWGEHFLYSDLSFDQWNSISFVQRLGRYMNEVSYKPSRVWERTTTAPLNWTTAETMKVALALNRVHMPYHELADLEMKFLRKLHSDKVDHPDTGPVTTKDVYDCISICIHKAIGGQIASAYGEQFSALRASTSMPGLQARQTGASQTYDSTKSAIADEAVHSMFGQRTGGHSTYGQQRFDPARRGAGNRR